MSRAQKVVDISATVIGTVVVFLGVVLISDVHLQLRIAVVLLGVLMIEVGVWKLASPFFRPERRYTALRAEADDFLGHVRRLNRAALEGRDADSGEIREAMYASVERMVAVAGKAEGTPP